MTCQNPNPVAKTWLEDCNRCEACQERQAFINYQEHTNFALKEKKDE
jgi:7-cyano-7-deazaguanine synthase in queuosine biosynthesis